MKKTISVLLAVVLLFASLSVSVAALPAAGVQTGKMPAQQHTLKHGEMLQYLHPDKSYVRLSEDPNAMYSFYPYLDARQKEVYDAVQANVMTPQTTFEIAFSVPISCNAVATDEGFEIPDETFEAYIAAILGGFGAFFDGNSEYFWSCGFMDNLLYEYSQTPNADGTYPFRILGAEISFELPNGYSSWTKVLSDYNECVRIADSLTIQGDTRYEQVKFIHDWIAERVQYDLYSQYPAYGWVTGVFLSPYYTVCEGYAGAFKMLCDRAGIPSVLVVDDNHAWNYVKMEDGNWYGVDVTWDDQETDGTFYDFFLAGAESTNCFFDETTFFESHTPTGSRYNVPEIAAVVYPTLSAKGYSAMLLAPNSTATVSKSVHEVYLYGNTPWDSAFAAPYGYALHCDESTGTLYVTKNSVTVETYTIVRLAVQRGDMNGDGKINAVDARWVLQASSGARTLTAEQKACADVNGDGRINAVDARWILQAASGARNLAA